MAKALAASPAFRLLFAMTVAAMAACGSQDMARPDRPDGWRWPAPGADPDPEQPDGALPAPARARPPQSRPTAIPREPALPTAPGDPANPGGRAVPRPPAPALVDAPGRGPGGGRLSSKVRWTFDDLPPGPFEMAERSDQAVNESWRNLFDAPWRAPAETGGTGEAGGASGSGAAPESGTVGGATGARRARGDAGDDLRPTWVVRGRWVIAAADRPGMSGRVLMQTETRPEPVASFVLPPWPGGAEPPLRYRVAVSVAAERAPRGQESPLLVWFRGVTHYAEIVAKPRSVEVWTADGAVPDRAEGWERLWYRTLATAPGEVRRLEATVDLRGGRMAVAVDGERLGEVGVPLMTRMGSFGIALRATGGPIVYDDLEVESLE